MSTSAEHEPSLLRIAPGYLTLVTSSNFWLFMLISALMLFVLLVMILLFSVFHSVYRCSVYESVGEVLKFIIVAARKIDVVGKSQVAYGPSTNREGCVVITEWFLHDLL